VPTTDERVKVPGQWPSLAKHEVGGRALLWNAATLGIRADQCGDRCLKPVEIGTGFAGFLG
jgi:hypothetical protein